MDRTKLRQNGLRLFHHGAGKVFVYCTSLALLLVAVSLASANYDPESIIDEIPVISAHSLEPEISGRYQAHRRNSEPDIEEVDDYDEDERSNQPRGSSSNNHDTYEEPAYGESRRAAREGEDIENFFDRHIGPNGADQVGQNGDYNSRGDPEERDMNNHLQAAASNGDQSRMSIPMLTRERDPFDMAAAASSPLATIFQTLLAAHKRPIVIEASDLSAALGDDSQTASSSSSGGQRDSASSTSSSSSSSIDGSSPTVAALGAASNVATMSPIASYLSPIAAPSSLAAYGQQMMEQAAGSGVADNSDGGDDNSKQTGAGDEGGQIQEIYIGRRPTLMSHFQSYAPQQQPQGLSHQSSNAAYWRGAAPPGVGARPQMMMMPNEQMANAYNADYRQYPVAASYAHQQESNGGGGGDDDGTVEYNLSFGGGGGGSGSSGSGSSASGDEGPEEMSSLSVDSQASSNAADETAPSPVQPMPIPASYNRRPMYNNAYYHQEQPDQSQSQHYQQQLQNAYRQQQEQHLAGFGAYGGRKSEPRRQLGATKSTTMKNNRMMQQQQYIAANSHQNNRRQLGTQAARQSAYPARYHKDPSESDTQPINYGQFRPMQHHLQNRQALDIGRQQDPSGRKQNEREWHHRQTYLAMLNREIKNSPRYDQLRMNTHDNRLRQDGGVFPRKRQMDSDDNSGDDDVYSNVQSETRQPTRIFTNNQSKYLLNGAETNSNAGKSGAIDNDHISTGKNVSNNATTIVVSSRDIPLPLAQNAQAPSTSTQTQAISDLLRNTTQNHNNQNHSRVKRQDDSDDRDDADDDGVWVEDDDDDDNSRQSSDVNETSQEPEDEGAGSQADDQGGNESGPQSQYNMQPIGGQVAGISLSQHHAQAPILSRPHSYEVSPDDAYGYATYPNGQY